MYDPDSIDWEEIWESLAWEDQESDEAALQKRLHQRAQQYAAPLQQEQIASDEDKTVLVFVLGEEHYGVDVMCVRSVRTIHKVTRVPGTPHFYRGVVNVRGQVITVMDLRLFFEIPIDEDLEPPSELVVVRSYGLEIGLLAHNVEGVITVPRDRIEPVDNMRYALGVTPDRLVLLDVVHMLEDDRLIVGGKDDS